MGWKRVIRKVLLAFGLAAPVGALVVAPAEALTPPRGVPNWMAQFAQVNDLSAAEVRALPYAEVPGVCKNIPSGLPAGSVVFYRPDLRVTGALALGASLRVGASDTPEGLMKTLQVSAPKGWRLRFVRACVVVAYGGDRYGSWRESKRFASTLSGTLTVDYGDGSYAVTVVGLVAVFGPPR